MDQTTLELMKAAIDKNRCAKRRMQNLNFVEWFTNVEMPAEWAALACGSFDCVCLATPLEEDEETGERRCLPCANREMGWTEVLLSWEYMGTPVWGSDDDMRMTPLDAPRTMLMCNDTEMESWRLQETKENIIGTCMSNLQAARLFADESCARALFAPGQPMKEMVKIMVKDMIRTARHIITAPEITATVPTTSAATRDAAEAAESTCPAAAPDYGDLIIKVGQTSCLVQRLNGGASGIPHDALDDAKEAGSARKFTCRMQ